MKHADYFSNFLKNTVNLSQFNLDLLADRVDAIYAALKADPDLGPRIIKKIPQGSWGQETIISPQNDKPFDADFLLQMKEESDWSDDVQEYINAVYTSSTTIRPTATCRTAVSAAASTSSTPTTRCTSTSSRTLSLATAAK